MLRRCERVEPRKDCALRTVATRRTEEASERLAVRHDTGALMRTSYGFISEQRTLEAI